MTNKQSIRPGWTLWRHTLTLSLFVSVLVFLGFRPLFELTPTGISKEILVAGIGALFVTLITLILLERQAETQRDLLRQQQEAQEKQKQSEHLYTRKIDQYNESIRQLHRILGNGVISIQDLDDGQFALSNLQLFGDVDACRCYQEVVEKMLQLHPGDQDSGEESKQLDGDEKRELYISICEFTNACRKDMGLEEIPSQQTRSLIGIDEQIEEKRLTARQPLMGGFAEFAQLRRLSDENKSRLKNFVHVLNKELSVTEKYTRSQISLAEKVSATKTRNIAYLTPQNERLKISVLWPNEFVDDAEKRERLFERLNKDSIEVEATIRKGKPSYPIFVSWDRMKDEDWHRLLIEAMRLCKQEVISA
jgi:hypothetical protein